MPSPRAGRGPPGPRILPPARTSSVEGQYVGLARGAGQGLLAPDDLARAGAAGTPAGGELADDLQAAAVLVVAAGLAQAGEGGRVVADLADQGALADEAQRHRARRGPQRV